MSEEAINEALDALEKEHNQKFDEINNQSEDDDSIEIEEPGEQESEKQVKAEQKPPGYLSYEEWVEKGKDPADFKGENAYKAEYERIQEMRELKETMRKVAETTQEGKQNMESQTRAQVEAELRQAREEEDIDAALAAQEKLNNLKQKEQQIQPEPNPVIKRFASQNPIIDKSSNQFDQEFYNDMAMIHDSTINKLIGGDPARQQYLTEAQIQRSLNYAYNEAKLLHTDKFQSPKNKRQAAPDTQRRPPVTEKPINKLKNVKGNSKNPNDKNAAYEIYEMLKERDPKAAEKFAATITGEN